MANNLPLQAEQLWLRLRGQMLSFSQSSIGSTISEVAPFLHAPRCKIINDPVHGHVRLDDLSLQFIDTPEFQRLRELKQLGTSYYVFPGASHNRFEHCIGVSHLAGTLLGRIRTEQPELEITDRELRLIRLAGLTHDLGHGPFSHVFDGDFIPRARPGATWSHEEMSLSLIDVLVDDNNIDMEPDDIAFVKEIIIASKGFKIRDRGFLYEIVANGRNSIDVDKFDYLARDTMNLGLKSSYDFNRLMNFSKVINDEICYHSKEVYNIYEMYHTRYSLFKQIYSHRAAKAVESMITDVMMEADIVWNRRLSSAIDNPREYVKLTDCVLKEIEVSADPALAKAQKIIRDLRCRRLYRFVDEYILAGAMVSQVPKPSSMDIVSHCRISGVKLVPDDVIVHDIKLSYTNKDKDPVSRVRFFHDWSDEESFSIKRTHVSYLLPEKFEERILRVYSRSNNSEKLVAIQGAFRAYLRQFRVVSPEAAPTSKLWSSPDKRNRTPDPSPMKPTGAVARRHLYTTSEDAEEDDQLGAPAPMAAADRPPRPPKRGRTDVDPIAGPAAGAATADASDSTGEDNTP